MTKHLALVALAALATASDARAQTYQSTVLADNPTAYYRFEETSGGTAVNSASTSTTFDGTYNFGVGLGQPGIAGNAASFDGFDDFVAASQPISDVDFSLEIWLKTTLPGDNRGGGGNAWEGDGLIWSDVGGCSNDYALALVTDHAAFYTGNTGCAGDVNLASSNFLIDGNWHHVVVVRDGGDRHMYVDGLLVSSTFASSNFQVLNGQSIIAIGKNLIDGHAYAGLLDEAALYNYALTGAQVAAHYAAAVNPVLEVQIDIKPGSFPNSINRRSRGVVPVAILSSADFDAATVAPSTVTLAGAPVRLVGNGGPQASLQDVNGDGLRDLVLHVSTEALELDDADTEAVLEGETQDAQPIRGRDSVRIVR
jgi:hypothetical protein